MVTVEIKVCLVAIKTDLSGSLTEMVIGVVALVASAIKIVEELVVLIKYKVSELEVFRVTIAERVKESVKLVGQ